MRVTYLILIIAGTPGCAALIENSGYDLSKSKNREEVRRVFGQPQTTGESDGASYDSYTTRRKIADPFRDPAMFKGYMITWGLADVVFVPQALCKVGERAIKGQPIQFSYDQNGNVMSVKFEGRSVSRHISPEDIEKNRSISPKDSFFCPD